MKARLVVAVLLALFALLTVADRFAFAELLLRRVALPLLITTVVALACIGTGAIARKSDEADPPLDFLIGLPLFGTLCYLVGLWNVSPWTMVPLTLLGAIVGVVVTLAGLKPLRTPVVLWLVVVCGAVAAAGPIPRIAHAWAVEGRAVALPLLLQYFEPLGVEAAQLPALTLLNGAMAPRLLHLFAAAAAILLVARRTESALLTAAIATTPALAIAADWPLTGLFIALFVLLERDDIRAASAATAAGLATSYIFLPFAIVAWALKRRRPHWIALAGVVFYLRPLAMPELFGVRELALADSIFTEERIAESLGIAIVALPAFAAGAIPIACAVLAVALFFLAPASRVLVPYLTTASLTAAPALKRRWFVALMAIAVALQTVLLVWFTVQKKPEPPMQPSIAWIHENLPAQSRTLLLGTADTFAFDKAVRAGDPARLSRYLELPTPDALRERFRKDGITHVAVIATKEERQTLTPAAQRMLAVTLDRYAASVTSRGDATLFTLR